MYRDPRLAERIGQGRLLSKNPAATTVGTTGSAASAKALAMRAWTNQGIGQAPGELGAPSWFDPGQAQDFSARRTAEPGVFQQWRSMAEENADVREGFYGILPPEPEPAPGTDSSASSSKEAG